MTRDFAKKKTSDANKASNKPKTRPKRKNNNSRKKTQAAKKPAWWLWVAALLGIVVFVIFLKKISDTTPSTQETPAAAKIAKEPPPQDTADIELDFYQILKEHKVAVDAEPIPDYREDETIVYWLQAASFKTYEEANTLRARLLLLNLEAVIEKTTDKQQRDWYRVLVGSFNSRSKMAKARSILASIEIKSLVIKRKIKP